MKITRASFVTSMAIYKEEPPIVLPQIAVAGKSNVGKSSLINSLCNQKKLCKTSSTPGKTRLINVFLINGDIHLIDLPGYGFAKVDKRERLRWGEMMERYFQESALLKHTLHLVDIRHEPTKDDIAMNLFLKSYQLPYTVVATKADKVSRGARMSQIALICRTLVIQPWDVIAFSSEDGTGKNAVLTQIGAVTCLQRNDVT